MRMRFLLAFITFIYFLHPVAAPLIAGQVWAGADLSEQARVLYNQAEFPEAISIYEEIISKHPREIEAYFNLAYLCKDLIEYKEAIRYLNKIPESLKDERLKLLLGRLYYLQGKPKQAISYLKQLSSMDAQTLFYLGLCYEDINKPAEAENHYLKAIRLNSDNALVHLKLGDIYYRRENFKEAARSYREVISLDPSITRARLRLAECMAKSGELEEAYNQYAKCLAIYPEDKTLRKELEKTKARLGEDFFKKKERLASERRMRRSIKVKPSVSAQAPQVRVGIGRIKGSVKFKCGSNFEIIDKQSSKPLFAGKKESIYSLVSSGNKTKRNIQLADNQGNILTENLNRPFLIVNKSANCVISIFDIPVGSGNFWAGWQDQQYRGIIEVVARGRSDFELINLINLEEYLYAVLPSEMPTDWPRQALCAQAIAARTWAIKNKNRHKRQGFNFCNSVHCQVYKGALVETRLGNQAVDETAGMILVGSRAQSQDKGPGATADAPAVDIRYCNNCGGHTRDGVFDGQEPNFLFPLSPWQLEDWLTVRPDTFCNLSEERAANLRWMRLYKQEELKKMLVESNIDVGEPLAVIPQKRAASGHLMSIKIKGKKDTRIIEGENNIRKILGNLRSSLFKIEVKYNQQNLPVEYVFYGGGFGHGRGMCQTGAKGMALKGYDYSRILEHYYPAARIKKIY